MPKYMPKMSTTKTEKCKDGTLSLSYPMLTRENDTMWVMKMKVFMEAHHVWEAIDLEGSKTIEKKTDKVALAAIYQVVSEDILLILAEKKTTKETWKAVKMLRQGAERVKKAQVQTLKAEFESMTMKDTDSLDDFHLKLNGLVTNIRVLGESVANAYVVKKILHVVPARFLQIASTIEQFGNIETMMIEEMVGSLKEHEECLRGQTENSGHQLLLTEGNKRERDEHKLLLTREE